MPCFIFIFCYFLSPYTHITDTRCVMSTFYYFLSPWTRLRYIMDTSVLPPAAPLDTFNFWWFILMDNQFIVRLIYCDVATQKRLTWDEKRLSLEFVWLHIGLQCPFLFGCNKFIVFIITTNLMMWNLLGPNLICNAIFCTNIFYLLIYYNIFK